MKIKAAILIGCLLILFYFLHVTLQAKPELAMQPYSTVSVNNIEIVVSTSGIVKPLKQVTVGAQVNGQLQKLYVQKGELVQAGQVLARIDATLAKNELKKSEVQYQISLAKMEAKQAQTLFSKSELDRYQNLSAQQHVSKSDLGMKKLEYDINKAELSALTNEAKQYKLLIETNKTNLEFTEIRAPISGTILSVLAEEGQTLVSSQMASTILTIGDLDQMTITAPISEFDIQKVKVGHPVLFNLPGHADDRYRSYIEFISPAPDTFVGDLSLPLSENTKPVYYNAQFNVGDQSIVLKPFMSVQVAIVIAKENNVLTIPLTALGKIKNGQKGSVKLQDNSGVIRVLDVSTGITDGENIQILNGLSEGDRVITHY